MASTELAACFHADLHCRQRFDFPALKGVTMFLQAPADGPATDRSYRSDVDDLGFVMNLSRLWAWRPEVCDAFAALRTLLTITSSLSRRELGVLVCATVASLGDSYCALAWGKRLTDASDPSMAAAVLRAEQSPAMTARDRALSAWARRVAGDANATTREDVEALRTAGLSEQEIFEATVFVAFRVAFSTVNDALGARPDWQLAAAVPPEVRDAVTFGRPTSEPTHPA
jgi:uncharacterized peroxidase-related enzyme